MEASAHFVSGTATIDQQDLSVCVGETIVMNLACVNPSYLTTINCLAPYHDRIVAGKNLDSAVYAMKELEERTRLYLLLLNQQTNFLSPQQCDELRAKFLS